MRKLFRPVTAIAVCCALPLGAGAQVVREDGVKSVAGVLYTEGAQAGGASEWTFTSAGGAILFATLDADIYRISQEGSERATAAAEGGGCSGEGGPGLFELKVLDGQGQVLCLARRPAPPPGWQRDPRLACALPVTAAPVTYTIRVELANPSGEVLQPFYPFLLNVSLRRIAPTGTNLHRAVEVSAAGGL